MQKSVIICSLLHWGVLQEGTGVKDRRVVLDLTEPAWEIIADWIWTHQVSDLTLQRLLALAHWEASRRMKPEETSQKTWRQQVRIRLEYLCRWSTDILFPEPCSRWSPEWPSLHPEPTGDLESHLLVLEPENTHTDTRCETTCVPDVCKKRAEDQWVIPAVQAGQQHTPPLTGSSQGLWNQQLLPPVKITQKVHNDLELKMSLLTSPLLCQIKRPKNTLKS